VSLSKIEKRALSPPLLPRPFFSKAPNHRELYSRFGHQCYPHLCRPDCTLSRVRCPLQSHKHNAIWPIKPNWPVTQLISTSQPDTCISQHGANSTLPASPPRGCCEKNRWSDPAKSIADPYSTLTIFTSIACPLAEPRSNASYVWTGISLPHAATSFRGNIKTSHEAA